MSQQLKGGYFDQKRKKNNRDGYLFIAPAMAAFFIFVLAPILMLIVFSFYDIKMLKLSSFVGLFNYKRILNDKIAMSSLKNTFKFLAVLVPIHVVLALLLAYFVSRVRFSKIRSLHRGIIYFPTLVPTASVAYVWAYMFATDTGFINYFIRQLGGTNIPWMTNKVVVYLTIAMFSFWKFIGTTFLYYFVGLQNIPSTYYEAAEIDGANKLQIFFRITLPLLTPTIFFVLVTNITGVFQIFDEPMLITNGGPAGSTKSFTMYIYETIIKHSNMGYGAVLSLFLLAIIMIITVIQFTGQKKWVVYDYE